MKSMLCSLVLGLALFGDVKMVDVTIGKIQSKAPETWKEQRPSSSMRIAQFSIPLAENDKGKAELVAFYSPAGMGSNEENIKRWKGQFKEATETKEDKKEVGDVKITTLDITGTYIDKPPIAPVGVDRPGYRMLAAIVQAPGDAPYYLKLTGPKESIKAQLDHWKKFLEGMKAKAE